MDPENTAPSSDGEISSEQNSEVIPASESVEGAETAETVEQTPTVEPAPQPDNEVDLLKRVIAGDPVLRQRYEAEKYGITPPVQPIQPQYAPPPQQQVEKPPFGGEPYDPYNPEHQAELFSRQLEPFKEFIGQQNVQQQQYERQQMTQQIQQMESNVHQMLDKELPNYNSDPVIRGYAEREFQNYLMTKFPPNEVINGQPVNRVWFTKAAHQETIQKITPTVRAYYSKIIGAPPKKTTGIDPALGREMHVEGSNAVPVSNANPFDDAYKKDDFLGMVKAVSRRK